MGFYLYALDKKYLVKVHREVNIHTMSKKNKRFFDCPLEQADILSL